MISPSKTIDHLYRYLFLSELDLSDNSKPRLALATSGGVAENPLFFEGYVLKPRMTALMLHTLAKLVATRYFIPAKMLEAIITSSDPVVTSGGGFLRFEGFSACCSAYARTDITPAGYLGTVVGHGTTNVDFNSALRNNLTATLDSDKFGFSIGPDQVVLRRGLERIVERKVQLPVRWIKGFAELQSYEADMECLFEVNRIEAMRFLRELPSNVNDSSTFFVNRRGGSLTLTQKQSRDSVRVSGLSRLKILQALAPMIDHMKVFAHPSGDASEWQLTMGPNRFCLTLSADVTRGFSGEGQALAALGDSNALPLIVQVKNSLKWQSQIDASALAAQFKTDRASVLNALTTLGTNGLVGFDLDLNSHFHRELPFNLECLQELNPRFRNASKLLDSESVTIVKRHDGKTEANVESGGTIYRVNLNNQNSNCSCPWFSKYQGKRGLCKHMLAVQMHTQKENA